MSRPRITLTQALQGWTLGALLIVWAGFVAIGYATGQHEADELTDGHLASASALLLAREGGFRPAPDAGSHVSSELKAHDYQQSLSVVVWDAQGRVLARSGRAPPPAFASDEGFATLSLGDPPEAWRAFARWDAPHQRRVMVLLSEAERDALADDIALQVSEPGLWLLPVVALVLGFAIWRGLRPLHRLAREVHALDVHRPQPLGLQPRHAELASTVDAIHRLVERYHAALSRERALADEFAHELRTPLTALALQARALREQPAPPGDEQLRALEAAALRAGEVVSHLLALARASRAELHEGAQPVDLAALGAELVAEFAPAAHQGGRDLALGAAAPLVVNGHRTLLSIALRNLLENALHHTPPGTQVEVQLDPGGRWLQVVDAPPAGAVAETATAAVSGLGLGHRVVQRVADVHGARFERLPGPGGGHCYRITFPAKA